MRPRGIADVARAVGGRVDGRDVEVTHVVTKSTEGRPGALFFALPGERTDGSLYVGEAFGRGAAAVVVREGVDVDGPALRVESPLEALRLLAADERATRMAAVTVVAVTGSNGKTSAKDMAAGILAARFKTHASPASFNNEIGLPVTLLTAPDGVELIVAEMGARREGDVRVLCEAARPDLAIVTNVGVAHMEVFGSWDAIVRAGAEPVEAIGPDGAVILCADDPVVAAYAERAAGRVVTFGLGQEADVRAEDVELDGDGRPSFSLVHGGVRERVELAVAGAHMVENALAAAACGLELGLVVAECAAGLKVARLSPWRMETFTSPTGVRVLNDAYNANPESMAAALKAARWMARGGRVIAVLGPMAELGAISDQEHERVGELVARIRVGRLVTVGANAALIARAAEREGFERDDLASYEDPADVIADVRAHARPGDLVLFKASRVAGLERIAEALR